MSSLSVLYARKKMIPSEVHITDIKLLNITKVKKNQITSKLKHI